MLLEPGWIGGLKLSNRIIFAPHASNTGGERGQVTDELINYYQRRAEGGVGGIVIGTVRVATKIDILKMAARQLCIDENSYTGGFLRLTETIHREGSKAIIQIQPGSGGNVGVLGEMDQWVPGLPATPVSPSGIGWPNCPKPRELATEEVELIIEAIAKGAYRAKLAEFDAVEINAHALYLIAQFMSPAYNRRRDKYGQDRLRLLLEIIQRIQDVNGKEFPIIVRYTIATWPYPLDEAFFTRKDVKEAQLTAKRLEKAGVAALHTSYNYVPWVFPEPSSHWPENFSLPMAQALKSAVRIPILLTGRVRDPELVESILRDGDIDFVAMVRPLIADPDLPRKYAGGKTDKIWSCIACNECFRSIERQVAVRCAVNPTAGRESLYDYRRLEPVREPKKVMVIGAGAAGMEATRVAALRGHQVTLVEKENELGCRIDLASRLPGRKTFGDINSYYSTAFKELGGGVEIARCSEVTTELIAEIEKEGMLPDVFIVATGGIPLIPDIPGVDGENVVTFLDVIADDAEIADTVGIIGANIIGCELALLLSERGKQVTLVELPGFCTKSDLDGLTVEGNIWALVEQKLQEADISLLAAEKIVEIADKNISGEDTSGNQFCLDRETVALSLGFTPLNKLTDYLVGKGLKVYTIGGASTTRKIKDAIYEGFLVASRI